ncbi:prevent-host-death family protein [Allochromatium warmingii]|uniref:Antitoxin n=1 Tax=Allochromatium warmingii TaxID=61595 RepID=A0A1H3FEV9_ALLWA|nr:type II toxin-antitoxin system prevent-host-death family antitoxin [Allochromatium warmingii]SDX89633.1 prevent-host-death family protein [Allochromatium warmingii]
MRSVQITEAKAHFSGLLAAVEAGETVLIMRRNQVIARLVPDTPIMAAEAFAQLWNDGESIDFIAPTDVRPEPVEPL